MHVHDIGNALEGEEADPHRQYDLQQRQVPLPAEPGQEIARLFEFVEVDNTDRIVTRAAVDTDFSTHTKTGDGQFRRKGIVGDWTNVFSASDRELFRRKVGDLFEEAGYAY